MSQFCEYDECMSASIDNDDEFMRSISEHTIFKYESGIDSGISYGGYIQVEDLPENNAIYAGKSFSLPREVIERIKTIIKRDNVIEINKLEFPPIIDGDVQSMYFRHGDRINAIRGYNQWFYYNKEGTNAYSVCKVVDEVIEIICHYYVIL